MSQIVHKEGKYLVYEVNIKLTDSKHSLKDLL